MISFNIITYGCTLNQADSDKIRNILKAIGYQETDFHNADVIIVNTCTVKHATESRIIEELKKLTRMNKKIVVTGCLYLRHEIIRELNPNIVVLSTGAIKDIVKAVESVMQDKSYTNLGFYNKSYYPLNNGVIANIPLCEGCLGNCYYCETRLARGKLVSYKPEKIIGWVKKSIKNGAKEIRLTAQDTGCYGLDIDTNLIELLNELLDIPGNHRFRLGMLNPEYAYKLKDELLPIFKNKNMFNFIHLPVQSGSDNILKKMNRRYTVGQFKEVVNEIRNMYAEFRIATDIISGYPFETENNHQATIKLLKDMKFDVVNMSRYTKRPNTPASKMEQIDNKVKKKRTVELHKLIMQLGNKINSKYVGNNYEVLLTQKNDKLYGRTNFYSKVALENEKYELGEYVYANIINSSAKILMGEMDENYCGR